MGEADRLFVAALYKELRAPEFAGIGWSAPVLERFLAQQEAMQHRQYREAFPHADWLIVERDGVPIGRLYVDSAAERLHLIDISLLPAARGCGIGTTLITGLLDTAERSGRFVRLRVAHGSLARRLYERLGFRRIADLGVVEEMGFDGRAEQVILKNR